MTVIEKVKKTINSYKLFQTGETLIVGVSGGPDSVALLHILLQLRREWGIQLHIAHANHGLRPSSRTDQKFVEGLAKKLNLPCSVTKLTVKPQKGKSSIEEQAREQRLIFFFEVAKRNRTKTVVLGHTQDDLAETVLMRIIRGTGLQGLQSILPKREFEHFFIVRPLIEISRAEILSYLKAQRIPFCIDPTNQQTKFFRNKIRLRLLPLLQKEYNPNIRELLANLAHNTAIDYDFLTAMGKHYLKKTVHKNDHYAIRLKINTLKNFPSSLKRMVLRLAIEDLSGQSNLLDSDHFRLIEQLIQEGPNQAVIDLPEWVSIQKNNLSLRIFRRKIS